MTLFNRLHSHHHTIIDWRVRETNRINKLRLIEPARLAALADLLDQESALLQKIDKLKIEANIENRERSIINLLERVRNLLKREDYYPKLSDHTC